MWYRCIISTIDFRNKTNFQLFSLFFPKTSSFFSKEPIRIGLSVTSFVGEIQPNTPLDAAYLEDFGIDIR